MKLPARAAAWLGAIVGLLLVGCGDDESNPAGPVKVEHYDRIHGWDCVTTETCQDVFDINFAAGSTVTFRATETTGNSVVQIALYGPGVALGGTNLFTGTANELRCNYLDGCDANVDGQRVLDFVTVAGGVYRFAVTRDWGHSCGESGSYRLIIDSDTPFSIPRQTVDDIATLAPDWECP